MTRVLQLAWRLSLRMGRSDARKTLHDSLLVMREVLDQSRTVDEALAILEKYNILWGSGPPLHYLIADANGSSVLVEYYQGKMNQIKNENRWHLATNFFVTPVEDNPSSQCSRYDQAKKTLEDTGGIFHQGRKHGLTASSQPTEYAVVHTLWNDEWGDQDQHGK